MTTEIIPVNRIEQALARENITERVIAQLKQDYLSLVVKGEDDKEGYTIVRTARLKCRDLRVLATKIAKAGREEAIAEQKAWITAEKSVTSQIEEVETYLEAQENIVAGAEKRRKEAEAETLRLAEEEKLRLAREKAQGRINALIKFGVAITWEDAASMPDSVFEGKLKSAEIAFNEAKERQRIADEARAEEDRIRKEESAKFEAEKKKQDEERRKLEAERHAIELEKAKTEAAEKARKDEADRIQREADEKKRKEEEAKKEEARLAALAPDKDKLLVFAGEVGAIRPPELSTDEAKAQCARAVALISEAIDILHE